MTNPIPYDVAIQRLVNFAETYNPERRHGSPFSLEEAASKSGISERAMTDFIGVVCSGPIAMALVVPESSTIELLQPGLLAERYPLFYGERRDNRERPGPLP